MSEINNINNINQNYSVSNTEVNINTSNTDSQPIAIIKKYTKEEILQKLGITETQYNELLIKHPDAANLSIDDLKLLLSKENSAQNINPNEAENAETENVNQSNENTAENENDLTSTQKPFDKAEYNKMSLEAKRQSIALELAKNNFLYGDKENPKTEDDWNNLTEEERNDLVNKSLSAIKSDKNGLAKIFTKFGQRFTADSTMSKIQAANASSISFKEFNSLPEPQREEYLYDYLNVENEVAKSEGRKPQFNSFERDFWNRNNLLAESANYYFEQQGIERNVCPGDVNKIASEEDLNIEQIQYNYLKNKIENGQNLSKYEKYQFKYLDENKGNFETDAKLDKLANEEQPALMEPPSLYAKIQNTEYAEQYNKAFPSEKAGALLDILKNQSGDDKKALYDGLVASAHDAKIKGDNALASDLMRFAAKVDPNRITQVDKNTTANELRLKTAAMSELSGKEAAQLKSGIEALDSKLAIAGNIAIIGKSNDEQALEMSRIDSKYTDVDNAMFDRGTKVENSDYAREIYTNIRKDATQETLNYVAANADKAQSTLQNEVLDIYTKGNQEATQAAIDAKTITRFDARNQTKGFRTLKNNAETLMSEKDAINALNTLSDQIKDCHKDNQLDMHNDIMSSKYSEVQEHAAGNIKDYDLSVQSQALDTVYESGNQKAIETAVSNLENAPSYIQEAEYPRAAVETVFLTNNNVSVNSQASNNIEEIQQKIAGGVKLSDDELALLTPQEKREYFVNYFKKLPIEQKIKLLSSMPNGVQKKTIYVMIARTDTNLFNAIIKDKDRADMLLSMGLPKDVNNKIANVVKFLAVSDIGYQNIAKKYDIDYKNSGKTNNQVYASNPYGFDSKEFYPKDKKGNLMV